MPTRAELAEILQFRRNRASTLRLALGIGDGDHALRSRKVRDHLEHFDERLDSWVRTSRNRHMVQDSIGPWGKTIMGVDEGDMMRWFDPEAKSFIFRGHRIDLRQLTTAIAALLPVAETKANELWQQAAQDHVQRKMPKPSQGA